MKLKEAYEKGLLKNGSIVRCNGDGAKTTDFYTGIITNSYDGGFAIRRDDCRLGGSYDGAWIVNCYGEDVEIFFEVLAYKISVKKLITKRTIQATYNGMMVYVNFREEQTLCVGDKLTIQGYMDGNKIYEAQITTN